MTKKPSDDKLQELFKAGKVSRSRTDDGRYRQVKVLVNKAEIDGDLCSMLTLAINFALCQIDAKVDITLNEENDRYEITVEK